jgi:hypothetical protein
MADVDVDRPGVAVGRVSPHPLEEDLPGRHPARRARQGPQDLELHECQGCVLAPRGHRSALEVDLEFSRHDWLLAAGTAAQHVGAPQGRLDPAAELAHRERLRHVVVGPHLEAQDLVDLVALGP